MNTGRSTMISIWTWVGIVLLTYGLLIAGSGLFHLKGPHLTVLGDTHPRIWWGALMTITGILFVAVLGRRKSSGSASK